MTIIGRGPIATSWFEIDLTVLLANVFVVTKDESTVIVFELPAFQIICAG